MDADHREVRDRERDHRVRGRHGVVAVLLAFTLFPSPAAPQSEVVQRGSERRAMLREANGPGVPGRAPEFAMLAPEPFRRPSADYSVTPKEKYQLAIAFNIAIGVLRTEPACRALFQPLGCDGEAILARTVYSDGGSSFTCQTGVPAYTTVRSTTVKLCHNFAYLRPSGAAVLLLHEALHSSGLRESPGYANAPTANEISSAVREGCKLQ